MVQINMAGREIVLKLVYYGPAFGGKTTNLEALHQITDPDGRKELLSVKTVNDRTLFFDLMPFELHEMLRPNVRGKMVTLDTADDRTLYFDFLPVEFGTQSGFAVKLKLFTVPGQVMHRSTRKVVLAGADGVAFIADSQRSSASANQYSWRDMEANLKANGIDFARMPKVVQFNKRDLPDVKPLEEIRAAWGDIPTFPAVATRGEGVVETFRELLRQLYRHMDALHGFGEKFGLSETDFVKGVLVNFSSAP